MEKAGEKGEGMKRLTYMSRFARSLSEEEIAQIGVHASQKNKREGVTGVLLCLGTLFFQIIEGEDEKIDQLFATMCQDNRHTDVICLQTELHITQRLFPDWSMNTINLDKTTDAVLRPIKLLLERVGDSQQIIEKYTQPSVSKIIAKGMNPLAVPVRKVEKIVLFTDIVAFSTISDKYPVEEVSDFVTKYLEICSRNIADRGGEVTKFIGDCVMAYFTPEQADDAIQACLDALNEMKQLRESASRQSLFKLLYSGFGLSQGSVIEGNIGSHVKMDYTIIGDPVNTAARLESLTRTVGKSLTLSASVKQSATKPWKFLYLGEFDLKGKDKVTEVYSIDSELTNHFNAKETIAHHLKTLENVNSG